MDHDFRSDAKGIAIPYGIYLPVPNTAMVFVGTSHDTPEFAVDCVEAWWRLDGRARFPGVDRLLILADGGGSNGARCRAWKYFLQHRLSSVHRVAVTVAHYPSGASKWNPIEHRLFSEITKNWAAIPLESYEAVLRWASSSAVRSRPSLRPGGHRAMIPGLPWEIPGIAVATLLYLLFDTYPIVKSFKATVCTGSFYLFWIILFVLNLITYSILKIGAAAKVKDWVGAELAPLTLILLATIGTIGILQSLTLKFADYKFIDVGKLIDGFRVIVLADITRVAADQQRLQAISVAKKLSETLNAVSLRTEYQTVMTFAGRTPAQIGQELNQLQADCTAANTSFERALAERIAQADIGHARQLLS